MTSGTEILRHRQPFTFDAAGRSWSFSFNGNIANYDELRKELSEQLLQDVDTDAIRVLLQQGIRLWPQNMAQVFRFLEEHLDGCFNIVLMDDEGNMWGYRDGHGFRPLVTSGNIIASEDSAIRDAFPEQDFDIADISPGELVTKLKGADPVSLQVMEGRNVSRCFFEWVYFSRLLSKLDGVQVQEAKQGFASALARREKNGELPAGATVIGVPDSGIAGGQQFAKDLDLPYVQAITRNPEAEGRSFLLGTREERIAFARIKYLFPDGQIAGKDIVLCEDSVVRGTTMEVLVQQLWDMGANSIHLRVSCPPIIAPCFYGIDFPTLRELLVGKYRNAILQNGGDLTQTLERLLAQELGLTSIRFLSKEDMLSVFEKLGLSRDEFCTACVDGTPEGYPTPAGKRRFAEILSEKSV